MACIYNGAPPLNTDIAGVGVRVSYYLQTLCLSLVAVLSRTHKQRKGALYTLWITNMAMAISAFVVGLKAEISFQDALVVLYLMYLSSLVSVFASVFYAWEKDGRLLLLDALQNYLSLAFVYVVLLKRNSFGSSPECNALAVFAYFHPVHALPAGWIVWLVLTAIGTIMYTFFVVCRMRYHPSEAPAIVTYMMDKTKRYHWTFYWLPILLVWGCMVVNIELLIRWNHFAPPDGPTWQFGQILPLFLVALPLSDTFSAFWRAL